MISDLLRRSGKRVMTTSACDSCDELADRQLLTSCHIDKKLIAAFTAVNIDCIRQVGYEIV
ncbi:hypothetical protein D3C84_1202130 [compost metagenome]